MKHCSEFVLRSLFFSFLFFSFLFFYFTALPSSMQRTPRVYNIAASAADYQSIFQSLKDWGSVDIVAAEYVANQGTFWLDCESATIGAICQSLRDKKFVASSQAGGSCKCASYGYTHGGRCPRFPSRWVLEVELPKSTTATREELLGCGLAEKK